MANQTGGVCQPVQASDEEVYVVTAFGQSPAVYTWQRKEDCDYSLDVVKVGQNVSSKHHLLKPNYSYGKSAPDGPVPVLRKTAEVDEACFVQCKIVKKSAEFQSPRNLQPVTNEDLQIELRQCAVADVVSENYNWQGCGSAIPPCPSGIIYGGNQDVDHLLDFCDLKSAYRITCGVVTDKMISLSSKGKYKKKKQYEVCRLLGTGNFGKVELCKDAVTQKEHARKSYSDAEKFQRREVDVMKAIKCPYIVGFKGLIFDYGVPQVLMEYAGVSLSRLVGSSSRAILNSRKNREMLALQGFTALAYMHKRNILHLDVKPENVCILLEPTLKLMLTDLGSCWTPQDKMRFEGWTPEYMSPEACQLFLMNEVAKLNANYTMPALELTGKTDVFGFGMTVSFMIVQTNLLTAYMLQSYSVETYMTKGRCEIIKQNAANPDYMANMTLATLKSQECMSPTEEELLKKTLAGNRNKRVSAQEAVDLLKAERQSRPIPVQPTQPSSDEPCQVERKSEICVVDLCDEEEDMEIDLRARKRGGGKVGAPHMAIPESTKTHYQETCTASSQMVPSAVSVAASINPDLNPENTAACVGISARPSIINIPSVVQTSGKSGKDMLHQKLTQKLRRQKSQPYFRQDSSCPRSPEIATNSPEVIALESAKQLEIPNLPVFNQLIG